MIPVVWNVTEPLEVEYRQLIHRKAKNSLMPVHELYTKLETHDYKLQPFLCLLTASSILACQRW